MMLLGPLLGEKFNSLERGKPKLFSMWISLHKSRKESGGRVSRALFRVWQVEKGRGARAGHREMPVERGAGAGRVGAGQGPVLPSSQPRLGKNSKTEPSGLKWYHNSFQLPVIVKVSILFAGYGYVSQLRN